MVTEPYSPSTAADSSAAGPATSASAADPAPAAPRLRLGGATKYSADVPAPAKAEASVAAVPTSQATPDVDATVVDAAVFDDAMSAEQARLDAERAARRQARVAALSQSPTEPVAQPAPVAPTRPVKAVTDRFWGSLALFGLRAVSAAILFIHGLNGLLNQAPAVELWTNTVLPFPRYVALGVSVAEVVVAILLVFGLLTRLAGLVQLGLMVLILTFVMWGRWSIFEAGGTGFIGEEELLLGAVGLAFLLLGAGGWSLDRAFRKGREREGLNH